MVGDINEQCNLDDNGNASNHSIFNNKLTAVVPAHVAVYSVLGAPSKLYILHNQTRIVRSGSDHQQEDLISQVLTQA